MRTVTHLGVTITGRRSVRYLSISNDADPEPITTPALSSIVGTPDARRISPVSAREAR